MFGGDIVLVLGDGRVKMSGCRMLGVMILRAYLRVGAAGGRSGARGGAGRVVRVWMRVAEITVGEDVGWVGHS